MGELGGAVVNAVLTDTHAHLDFPEFAADFDAVLARAEESGVRRIITIGTTLEGSRRAVEIAHRHRNVFAAIGVHPGNAEEAPVDVIAPLRELARHPRVVALGECGLDYHHLPAAAEPASDVYGVSADHPESSLHAGAIKVAQAAVFEQQLDLAVELGLNVIVHERDAWTETLRLLAPYTGKLRAVFHCFGKSLEHAEQVIALGHLVSFTGIVTFKNAPTVHEAAARVPDGSFMVETDCPFLAPVPYRGKRCEPAHTRTVAERIATLRGTSLEQIAAHTEATANAFFRFTR